jgi:hypothetical protein
MSALGQKRTCAVHKPMSALPPIATAKADMPSYKRGAMCSPRNLIFYIQPTIAKSAPPLAASDDN